MASFIPCQISRNQTQMHHKRTALMQIGDMAEAAPRVCLNKAKFNFGDVAGVLKMRSMCCANMLFNHSRCVRARRRAHLASDGKRGAGSAGKEEDPAV